MESPLKFNPVSVSTEDEYDNMRTKYFDFLTGGTGFHVNDPDISGKLNSIHTIAQGYWDTMEKSSERSCLWRDLPYLETRIGQVTSTYKRLQSMSLAYATSGNALYGNPALRDDITSALLFMYANFYNETTPRSGNWWDYEIGIPLALGSIVVLLYNDLPKTSTAGVYDLADYYNSIDRNIPDPAVRTGSPSLIEKGANRVWKSLGVITRGIIGKSSTKIAQGRDALSLVLDYVTSGDGFYTDGSFIQHQKHPYTLGYGEALLTTIAHALYILAGSSWAVTDPDIANVFRWVYDSYEMSIYRNSQMISLGGREPSRGENDTNTVINSVILLSKLADSTDKMYFQGLAKYWMDFYPALSDYYSVSSLQHVLWAKSIYANAESRGDIDKFKLWANMDRAVKQSPNFGFELSMHSSRIYDYEGINNENIGGHFMGSGMTYLHTVDDNQYKDGYLPTVNVYRLPGTTVLKGTKADTVTQYSPSKIGTTDFNRKKYVTFSYNKPRTVLSAKLRLYGSSIASSHVIPVDAIELISSDISVEPGSEFSAVCSTVFAGPAAQWREWDVTDFVRTKVITDNTPTFLYSTNDSSGNSCLQFNSWEASSNTPQLIITSVDDNNTSPFDWVGGSASVSGKYGAVGMQFDQKGKTLTGKKSWFVFDDEIVCLGSNISSTDGIPVESIVDNRKLNADGSNVFMVNGVETIPAWGAEYDYTNTNTLHLSGNVSGADVGYYFPGGTTVKALREKRTGSYKDINPGLGSTQPYTNHFMNLWFDHGPNPTDASYQYVLLPGYTTAQVDAYQNSPEITVLENSEDAHAVKENGLHIVGVNFWNDITKKVDIIQSNKKASVMVEETSDSIYVSVSDPTMLNTGTIDIEIDRVGASLVSKDPEITITQLIPRIKFSVNVNGAKGKTFKAQYAKTLSNFDGDSEQII